jgi:hypothetical protein
MMIEAGMVSKVLRAPVELVAETPEELAERGPALVAVGAAGLAVYGAAVGWYHGGLMVPLAALKLPVAFLVALGVCLPSLKVLMDPEGGRVSWLRAASAGLVGVAQAGLLAAAVAPVLWLFLSVEPDYYSAVQGVALLLGLAGLPGLWTALRIARPDRILPLQTAAGALVLGLVVAQSAWLFRPFVLEPSQPVQLLRPLQDDVFDGLDRTTHGPYRRGESY